MRHLNEAVAAASLHQQDLLSAQRYGQKSSSCPDRTITESLRTILRIIHEHDVLLREISETISGTWKQFFTVEEFAQLVGRAPCTVRRWITAGIVKATRVEGAGPRGRLLVHRGELDKVVGSGFGDELALATEHDTSKKLSSVPCFIQIPLWYPDGREIEKELLTECKEMLVDQLGDNTELGVVWGEWFDKDEGKTVREPMQRIEVAIRREDLETLKQTVKKIGQLTHQKCMYGVINHGAEALLLSVDGKEDDEPQLKATGKQKGETKMNAAA
jgi:hypothetical protein